jgi:two-component system sensor histidine kinase GlrK
MQETNRLLLDEIPGPLTDKQRRFLALNIDGGRRLAAMITNLLELSYLEAGVSYIFSRQDLAGLASVAVAEFEARAREKQITLILKPAASPLFVRCDRDRMLQVFENLLENAVKFSPRDSEVRVQIGPPSAFSEQFPKSWCRTLSESLSEGGVGVVSIADSGEGIPSQQREKVFNKFYQLDGKQRRNGGGVGLGLAICREIVEAHKGAIWVTDNEPTGATFYILLPRFAVLAEEPQDSPLLGEARAEESRA